ncbi:MAG: YdcF family protein [Cohnella sp.]|nr:YdcF family protein [Cohnella sp.]
MRRLTEEGPLASRSAKSSLLRSTLIRRALRTVVIGLLIVAVWCGVLYTKIVTFDGTPDEAQGIRSDVGIVLGAGLWGEEPSPALKERLDYAIALFHEGLYARIIVTGGLGTPDSRITDAEGAAKYLIARGVPEESVALENSSKDTYENLLFAQRIMQEQGWQSAAIVTHWYHGSRAADMARTLAYDPVRVFTTDTKVMNRRFHEGREVLAYTKWFVRKLFL